MRSPEARSPANKHPAQPIQWFPWFFLYSAWPERFRYLSPLVCCHRFLLLVSVSFGRSFDSRSCLDLAIPPPVGGPWRKFQPCPKVQADRGLQSKVRSLAFMSSILMIEGSKKSRAGRKLLELCIMEWVPASMERKLEMAARRAENYATCAQKAGCLLLLSNMPQALLFQPGPCAR